MKKAKQIPTVFPKTMALIESLRQGTASEDDKVTPEVFAEMLEMNEDSMSEGAAMAVTCEMFGLSIDEGHQLLIEASEEDEDE